MLRFSMFFLAPSTGPRRGTVDVMINGRVIPRGAGHFDSSSGSHQYYRWDVPVSKWRGERVRMSVVGHERLGLRTLLDDFTLRPR